MIPGAQPYAAVWTMEIGQDYSKVASLFFRRMYCRCCHVHSRKVKRSKVAVQVVDAESPDGKANTSENGGSGPLLLQTFRKTRSLIKYRPSNIARHNASWDISSGWRRVPWEKSTKTPLSGPKFSKKIMP